MIQKTQLSHGKAPTAQRLEQALLPVRPGFPSTSGGARPATDHATDWGLEELVVTQHGLLEEISL